MRHPRVHVPRAVPAVRAQQSGRLVGARCPHLRDGGRSSAVLFTGTFLFVSVRAIGATGKCFLSQHADSTDQMRRILAAKYAFPEGVSPAFKDVVRRFLSVNAVHRLGSLKGGVKDVKLHPWFKSTDW